MPRSFVVAVKVFKLSPREHVLCEKINSGLTFKEAANAMGIQLDTAYSMSNRIKFKLGVDRTDAIIGIWPHVLGVARWQRMSVVASSTRKTP